MSIELRKTMPIEFPCPKCQRSIDAKALLEHNLLCPHCDEFLSSFTMREAGKRLSNAGNKEQARALIELVAENDDLESMFLMPGFDKAHADQWRNRFLEKASVNDLFRFAHQFCWTADYYAGTFRTEDGPLEEALAFFRSYEEALNTIEDTIAKMEKSGEVDWNTYSMAGSSWKIAWTTVEGCNRSIYYHEKSLELLRQDNNALPRHIERKVEELAEARGKKEELEKITRGESTFDNIFDAARAGTVQDVRYFVETKRVDINVAHHRLANWTPLFFAATSNPNVAVVEYLLSQKDIQVNARDIDGNTPLHMVDQVRCGLAQVASMFGEVSDDGTAVKVVDALIKAKADIYATNKEGKTPLDVTKTESIKNVLREAGRKKSSGCLAFLAASGTLLTSGICGWTLFAAMVWKF